MNIINISVRAREDHDVHITVLITECKYIRIYNNNILVQHIQFVSCQYISPLIAAMKTAARMAPTTIPDHASTRDLVV